MLYWIDRVWSSRECTCCACEPSVHLSVPSVEGMSVVGNVMLYLMSVMSPPPALCNILGRTVVRLCTLGVFALGVSLVS